MGNSSIGGLETPARALTLTERFMHPYLRYTSNTLLRAQIARYWRDWEVYLGRSVTAEEAVHSYTMTRWDWLSEMYYPNWPASDEMQRKEHGREFSRSASENQRNALTL